MKWTCYHPYVILDIFSRYVVGWMIPPGESAQLAKQLIAQTVAELLVDLEVTKSHSRPYVSGDNPYSEAHFKTLKYRPDFPASFGCIEDARAHCQGLFPWCNDTHLHSGIGYKTPAAVHCGQAQGL